VSISIEGVMEIDIESSEAAKQWNEGKQGVLVNKNSSSLLLLLFFLRESRE
jgi:hypothetical protein